MRPRIITASLPMRSRNPATRRPCQPRSAKARLIERPPRKPWMRGSGRRSNTVTANPRCASKVAESAPTRPAEAQRDPADGRAGAAAGHPRRDRLGPGHRRPQGRGRRCHCHAQPRAQHPPGDPLPALAGLHRAGPGACPGPRPHRPYRRARAGEGTGGAGLRVGGSGRPACGGTGMSATATANLVRSPVDAYRASLARYAADPPWLRRVREQAFERYASLGLPTLRDEDWKYTNVSALEKRAYPLAADGIDTGAAARVAALALPGCARLVFVNGHHAPALSDLGPLGLLAEGVTVGSLATVAARPHTGESWLAGRLTVSGETPRNGFEALNAALWTDGACIDLPAGTVLQAPLQLLFLTTRPELAMFPRNLIRLGAGARAEIIEHHAGVDDGAYFTNAVTGIVLERGARLTYVKLQEEGRRAYHIADLRAEQGEGSGYASLAFTLGAQLARADIRSEER